ncbi:ASCH domain-containing protein [Kitasatospora aureofaciens]|uniref:ASCH domain-containing protein n=1 Tax=Kitasatospora aureofaciens TaxID=1894 RepID=UPI0037C7754D
MAKPAADVPALTIRQPWLAAILAGDKTVENRSWPTKHRGPVVLHAARALARDGQTDPHVRAVLARPGAPALTTGALVATASITDCHRDTGCCRPWGLPGLWHWHLDDVQALPDPIPVAGRLGLWRLDPGQHALLHRHQAAASPPSRTTDPQPRPWLCSREPAALVRYFGRRTSLRSDSNCSRDPVAPAPRERRPPGLGPGNHRAVR